MSGESGMGLKMLEGAAAFSDVASKYTGASGARTSALYDAMVADAEAADARRRGGEAAARKGAQTQRRVGSVRAQVAGRGFTTGKGTAGDLETGTDLIGQLDALTIKENARKETLSHSMRASGARLRAGSIKPGMEAFGTLIGHSGRLARQWETEE